MEKFEQLIQNIKEYAKEHKVPIITEDGLRTFIELLSNYTINSMLEIGSAIGYSAIMFHHFLGCTIDTIERNKEMVEIARKNIKSFDLEDKINIMNKDALDVDETELGLYDCIFIDAAKAQYQKFFEKYQHNLTKNGMIICDNLSFHGLIYEEESKLTKNVRGLVRKIKSFREYLLNNTDFDTVIYDIGDGISISIKKG